MNDDRIDAPLDYSWLETERIRDAGRQRVDWTTTDACPRCNEHGPYAASDRYGETARDAHQAWHTLTAVLLAPLVPVVEWLSRRPTS